MSLPLLTAPRTGGRAASGTAQRGNKLFAGAAFQNPSAVPIFPQIPEERAPMVPDAAQEVQGGLTPPEKSNRHVARIRGVIRGTDGQPISGARIAVSPSTCGFRVMEELGTSGTDGTFSLAAPAGPLYVAASSEGRFGWRHVASAFDDIAVLVEPLARVMFRLSPSDASGENIVVLVRNCKTSAPSCGGVRNWKRYSDHAGGSYSARWETAHNGTLEIGNMMPGCYDFELHGVRGEDSRPPLSERLEWGAGSPGVVVAANRATDVLVETRKPAQLGHIRGETDFPAREFIARSYVDGFGGLALYAESDDRHFFVPVAPVGPTVVRINLERLGWSAQHYVVKYDSTTQSDVDIGKVAY